MPWYGHFFGGRDTRHISGSSSSSSNELGSSSDNKTKPSRSSATIGEQQSPVESPVDWFAQRHLTVRRQRLASLSPVGNDPAVRRKRVASLSLVGNDLHKRIAPAEGSVGDSTQRHPTVRRQRLASLSPVGNDPAVRRKRVASLSLVGNDLHKRIAPAEGSVGDSTQRHPTVRRQRLASLSPVGNDPAVRRKRVASLSLVGNDPPKRHTNHTREFHRPKTRLVIPRSGTRL
ncbi:uncharacterized protein LOC134285418 [Aedes albopictus]|uniref:Secreted protein n=1 Tax=Aedes albopictus TaxID=7160 RepID=A0ABM1XZP1_AEDAL